MSADIIDNFEKAILEAGIDLFAKTTRKTSEITEVDYIFLKTIESTLMNTKGEDDAWIVKDNNGRSMYISPYEPTRDNGEWDFTEDNLPYLVHAIDSNSYLTKLLPFIDWENGPYKLKDLIFEYEYGNKIVQVYNHTKRFAKQYYFTHNDEFFANVLFTPVEDNKHCIIFNTKTGVFKYICDSPTTTTIKKAITELKKQTRNYILSKIGTKNTFNFKMTILNIRTELKRMVKDREILIEATVRPFMDLDEMQEYNDDVAFCYNFQNGSVLSNVLNITKFLVYDYSKRDKEFVNHILPIIIEKFMLREDWSMQLKNK